MCGFAGWIGKQAAAPPQAALQAMCSSIRHRGPDGEGFFHRQTRDGAHAVGLGHRRLAIIDLATGDQPMSDAEGRLTVVFNGEIYNFRELRDELSRQGCEFRTRSDTEVLLQGWNVWGTALFGRLSGMFAFALWDSESETLVLARDAYGEKPLFLHQAADCLFFGSEVKSLLAVPSVPRRLSEKSVWEYLSYRYVPGPETLFDGITKLPPGHFGIWTEGAFSIARYFNLPERDIAPEPIGPDPVRGFLERLDASVAARMVSDVPFGAFLSGGIDSSVVVGLMSRHSDLPVRTFAVGFSAGGESELSYAAEVAEAFRTEHVELVVKPEDVVDYLPQLIAYRDAPVTEPSDVAIYKLALRARESVKMVLTGEGADELLAGYPKHRYEGLVSAYQAVVPAALHDRVIQPAVNALPFEYHRAKTAVASFGVRSDHARMARWFGALGPKERGSFVGLASRDAAPRTALERRPALDSALRRILCFDQESWLPDNLLERGDRMTMAASLEARMPFLDTAVATYLARLPDHFRLRGKTSKWILRQAAASLVPESILARKKIGFKVPVATWFRGPLREYLSDHLLAKESLTSSFYSRKRLEQVVSEHVGGRQNHEKLLWTLLTLELFQRRYRLDMV